MKQTMTFGQHNYRFSLGGRRVSLVERNNVILELTKLLGETARGSGKIALITGGIATGKTALVRAFEERAVQSGVTVLRASGAASEQMLRFGLVEQFCRGASIPPELSALLAGLIAPAATPARAGRPGGWPVETQVAHSVCVRLLELTHERPLLITVDDHQFADSGSMQVLTYLQHRIGAAKVMLLLTHDAQAPSTVVTEALREPHCSQFALQPLSIKGVGELVAARTNAEPAFDVAAGYHELTGGNPLLAHALVDDQPALRQDEPPAVLDQPVIGEAFTRAVLTCMHRGGPRLVEIARAIAVLGEFATSALVARFLGVRLSVVTGTLEALAQAGLTVDTQFRSPAAAAAVLNELTPEEVSTLNLRAAELLYHDGAAPSDVVGYLLAAGEAEEPWAIDVLKAGVDQALVHADQMMAAGQVEEAVRYLEFTSRACDNEAMRATLTARIASMQWTINPAAAARHLGPLQATLAKGLLSDREMMHLVRSLAWLGRPDEAVRALELVGNSVTVPGAQDSTERKLTREWLAAWHPKVFAAAKGSGGIFEPRPGEVFAKPRTHPAHPAAARKPTLVDRAEQVLQGARVGDVSLESVVSALHDLIAAGQSDRAMYWCDELLREAERDYATTWSAVLLDTRAGIRLQRGDLVDAERDASTALSIMSPHSWGVAIGSPLSHLVLATTMMGKFDEAAKHLNRRVPHTMAGTRYQLQYLAARGVLYLATNRPHAALDDFKVVGDLAVAWQLDHPNVLPWRGLLAQALNQLGQVGRARKLITEQLEMIGTDSPRMRGVSLSILASVSEQRQRLQLLSEAVDLLWTSGDRYQLAQAFAELSQVWQTVGELERARLVHRRALQLAKRCNAEWLSNKLTVSWKSADGEVDAAKTETAGMSTLSEAERRVATLAALGRTNREISRKLHITVSTVEQHLTRVYRKLNIKRRTDLPVSLPRGHPRRPHGRQDLRVAGGDIGVIVEQATAGLLTGVIPPRIVNRGVTGAISVWHTP
ncbi:AAA family ATPase [Kibdelosporangium aridum]|uniref:AAA family ATPase n=1 Tax=Kibdelosporangium aridum TaxID=2030 RepID=UPI0035EC87D1